MFSTNNNGTSCQQNDPVRRLDLTIDRTNFKGEGYGRTADGAFYRVSNALDGERVLALEVAAERRRIAYLEEVLSPSNNARTPFCPHWRDCAACQYSRLTVGDQQKLKEAHWLRLIRRFVPTLESAQSRSGVKSLCYRHRARARFSNGRFVMPVRMDAQLVLEQYGDTCLDHPVERDIPLHDCRLHADCLNEAMKCLEALLSNRTDAALFEYDIEAFEDNARLTLYAPPLHVEAGRGLARFIAGSIAGDALSWVVILQPVPARGSHVYPPSESFGKTPWYGYARNSNHERLEALNGAWTPVNPDNAMAIREILRSCLECPLPPVKRILELGCGCGTHADIFDRFDVPYHGIDASWPAIQSAQHNARVFGWKNKTFQTSTALHYLDKNYYRGARADLILMHSNRLPYGADVASWCRRFGAHTILVVAPTAYAMAQECQDFIKLGYAVKQLLFCDTLPFTYHMMAVAMLQLE